MNINVIFKNTRCAALELKDESVFETAHPWNISVNGTFYKKTDRVITMIYGLEPETAYTIQAEWEGEVVCADFQIPVLDFYNTSAITEKTADQYLFDGLHPNQDGFQVIARELAAFLCPGEDFSE